MLSDRERRALILIGAALILGIGLILVKAYNPSLFLGEPDFRSEDMDIDDQPKAISLPDQNESSTPIDINKASKEKLQMLPGIGPTLAERIIQYREKHGGFKRIEEIKQVRGIGEKTFQRIKSLITVR
jgi:competence protein ComEA